MARVRLVNLTKRFGTTIAVDHVNLDIADGEFLVLVGPSGCGKTTCLRMIAGLEEPTEGEIWIGDRLVNELPPKERNVAMVFQNYALYPHMTAYDNMAFALRMQKADPGEIDRRVRWAAELLGITEILDRKPKQLSGGQRQRVAVGRAIVREPDVFLMDEPLSNLDAKMRVQMRAELLRLHRRLGVTTIYVTHDQQEAMSLGQRIAIMRRGRILQVDTPLGVYYNPADRFVAGFIGTPPMNFVEALVEETSDGAAIDAGEFRVAVAGPKGEAAREYSGKPVILGIRPQDIRLEGGDRELATAQVELVEILGAEAVATLAVGTVKLTALFPASASVREGQKVRIGINPEDLYLFDGETGAAIFTAATGREAELLHAGSAPGRSSEPNQN